MAYRVTKQDLENKISRINDALGTANEPYAGRDENGNLIVNAGCVYLSSAYGGYCLEQMCKSGGCTSFLPTGYVSKKELFNAISYWFAGWYAKESQKR